MGTVGQWPSVSPVSFAEEGEKLVLRAGGALKEKVARLQKNGNGAGAKGSGIFLFPQ
jgi:hypothetical protein